MLAKLMNWLYPRNARIVWQPPEQWHRNLHGLTSEQRSERSRKSAATRRHNKLLALKDELEAKARSVR